MDKTKAFDLCKFSLLFTKINTKINPVFTRFLIFSYCNQRSMVVFNGECSTEFNLRNSVGQGKVLVGFLYCFYCQELFVELEECGLGCQVNGVYASIFGFSDDDIAITPTFSMLEGMMTIIQKFAYFHGLKFSIDPNLTKSKTKCMAWLIKPKILPNIVLDSIIYHLRQLLRSSIPFLHSVPPFCSSIPDLLYHPGSTYIF